MALSDLPVKILQNFEVHEWRHAVAILKYEFPDEYKELVKCLNSIKLTQTDILAKGGGKTNIASAIDSELYNEGWVETYFETSYLINGVQKDTPTHSIDCYKNKIAVEVEWNNKTEFYDRDLNNFRLLHERGVISVGVIITRASELQLLFNKLGKGDSYGASTTHMDKLVPRINGGSGGGCPILIVGIKNDLYEDQDVVNDIKAEIKKKQDKEIEKQKAQQDREQNKIDAEAKKNAKELEKQKKKDDKVREKEIEDAVIARIRSRFATARNTRPKSSE